MYGERNAAWVWVYPKEFVGGGGIPVLIRTNLIRNNFTHHRFQFIVYQEHMTNGPRRYL